MTKEELTMLSVLEKAERMYDEWFMEHEECDDTPMSLLKFLSSHGYLNKKAILTDFSFKYL